MLSISLVRSSKGMWKLPCYSITQLHSHIWIIKFQFISPHQILSGVFGGMTVQWPVVHIKQRELDNPLMEVCLRFQMQAVNCVQNDKMRNMDFAHWSGRPSDSPGGAACVVWTWSLSSRQKRKEILSVFSNLFSLKLKSQHSLHLSFSCLVMFARRCRRY